MSKDIQSNRDQQQYSSDEVEDSEYGNDRDNYEESSERQSEFNIQNPGSNYPNFDFTNRFSSPTGRRFSFVDLHLSNQESVDDRTIDSIDFEEAEDVDPNVCFDDEMQGLESGSEMEDNDDFGYASDESILSDVSDASSEDSSSDEVEREEGLCKETTRIFSSFTSSEIESMNIPGDFILHDMNGLCLSNALLSGSSRIFNESELRDMSQNGWNCLPDNTVPEPMAQNPADRKYEGYCGPSANIIRCATTILGLFFYFLPHSLWSKIASESNRYWRQTFDQRVEEQYQRNQSSTTGKKKTREQIEAKLHKFRSIQPHEIVQYIGLWIAHVLLPRKRMHSHWASENDGVLPSGTFGSVMSRQRFQEISRFLHFSDNKAPQAKTDRAWKIRPILNTMKKTFKQGYVLGYEVALDEGMLVSHSRYNPTRTYMKDKPHKWGSKCVLTCCATTGYCKRYELNIMFLLSFLIQRIPILESN